MKYEQSSNSGQGQAEMPQHHDHPLPLLPPFCHEVLTPAGLGFCMELLAQDLEGKVLQTWIQKPWGDLVLPSEAGHLGITKSGFWGTCSGTWSMELWPPWLNSPFSSKPSFLLSDEGPPWEHGAGGSLPKNYVSRMTNHCCNTSYQASWPCSGWAFCPSGPSCLSLSGQLLLACQDPAPVVTEALWLPHNQVTCSFIKLVSRTHVCLPCWAVNSPTHSLTHSLTHQQTFIEHQLCIYTHEGVKKLATLQFSFRAERQNQKIN